MQLKHRRARARAARARGNVDVDTRESVAARQLSVAWGRWQETVVVWLGGTLDRETRSVLETELGWRPAGPLPLIVDLTALEFIDASGVEALALIQSRATERGERLSFRHGQHVAQRPIGLIRSARLRSERASRRARSSSREDSSLALAMACANVDHPGLGDRPRAA